MTLLAGLAPCRGPVSERAGVGLERLARADQVAVAGGGVDARHRREVLRRPQRRQRVGAELAGVGPVPLAEQLLGGVRGVAQRARRRAATSPAATLSISPRIAIIASQKRSSSASVSLSVGSIISVPATGKLIVGAWKP